MTPAKAVAAQAGADGSESIGMLLWCLSATKKALGRFLHRLAIADSIVITWRVGVAEPLPGAAQHDSRSKDCGAAMGGCSPLRCTDRASGLAGNSRLTSY